MYRILLLGEAPSVSLGASLLDANRESKLAGRVAGSLLCDLSHISCLEIPDIRETDDMSEEGRKKLWN